MSRELKREIVKEGWALPGAWLSLRLLLSCGDVDDKRLTCGFLCRRKQKQDETIRQPVTQCYVRIGLAVLGTSCRCARAPPPTAKPSWVSKFWLIPRIRFL